MTEQDKQALIEYYCNRDCGHTREECCLDNCHEIMLIEEFPITPTDTDTISRQAAIDALGEKPLAWEQGEYEEGLQTQWESDVEAIKVLPSAQPEPKRGRWTRDNACSECGYQPWFSGDIHNYNFCPNCGADMRGEQDG